MKKGFTLIEILLVVAAIGILAGVVILAINPGKQLGDTRNAQRWADVNTILNGIYQYSIDNNGDLPGSIPSSSTCSSSTPKICQMDGSCSGLTDLSDLTDGSVYLVDIPDDPTESTGNSTYYAVIQTTEGRVTVCAPGAEQSETIEATR
ncbi:prepilin-type N-terminal cleavage/methylation domain-containing protein [Candidatus Uhrbacteria bacterium]|jgi:prepilin-type N-terminal cleavage/methylation domain-containing protein|nr:prepilin-type N-terminal cleavage/methylation domain-containing protein [Candidatus Uhrbacteria bacterium]MBT7717741.1 prepilin-type N-terminal cleavage/methylation domain-containing protein [Candidatus Uhrbacteria bacterium]